MPPAWTVFVAVADIGAAWATALDAGASGLQPRRANVVDLEFDGRPCIAASRNCYGDNRDAAYRSSLTGPLDDDTLVAVIGANHTQTGSALLTSVSANHAETLLGITATDAVDLIGSSFAFGDFSDRTYVVIYGRHHHPDLDVTIVPEDFPGLPADGNLAIGFRAYIDPETGTGPANADLIPPTVIVATGVQGLETHQREDTGR
jgi:hypothetical protein